MPANNISQPSSHVKSHDAPKPFTSLRDEIFTFLQRTYGQKDDEHYLAVWRLQDRQSRFFADIDKAVEYINDVREEYDVYTGVGVYETKPAEGRGKAEDVIGITSLWADIDCYDEVLKQNLPRDATKERR